MKLPAEESDFIFCDVQDIVRYLRRRNPAAAVRFVEAFNRILDLAHGLRPVFRNLRCKMRLARPAVCSGFASHHLSAGRRTQTGHGKQCEGRNPQVIPGNWC